MGWQHTYTNTHILLITISSRYSAQEIGEEQKLVQWNPNPVQADADVIKVCCDLLFTMASSKMQNTVRWLKLLEDTGYSEVVNQ